MINTFDFYGARRLGYPVYTVLQPSMYLKGFPGYLETRLLVCVCYLNVAHVHDAFCYLLDCFWLVSLHECKHF